MKNPNITIVDALTGEQEVRPMTDEEFAILKKDQEALAAKLIEEQTKADARAALLERLGITEEEAQLLLG